MAPLRRSPPSFFFGQRGRKQDEMTLPFDTSRTRLLAHFAHLFFCFVSPYFRLRPSSAWIELVRLWIGSKPCSRRTCHSLSHPKECGISWISGTSLKTALPSASKSRSFFELWFGSQHNKTGGMICENSIRIPTCWLTQPGVE